MFTCSKMDFSNAGYCIKHDKTISISKSVQSHWSELHTFAYHGDLENIKRLLRRKHDVNSADDNGLTALMLASSEGHDDMAYFLLNRGADVNAVTKENVNALMFAARKGHDDIVYGLIKHNANYKIINSQGNNPLMIACWKGSVKIVELLLCLHADVNVISKKGETALMIATYNEHEAIVDILLKNNADCNLVNDINFSCLMIAAEIGNCRLVELLLHHKADCNIVNKYNYNALKYAAEKGHSQVVKLLLQYGAVDKHVDNTELSALNLASINGHLKTVEGLLQNVTDSNLFSSFRLAALNKKTEVAQLLLRDPDNYLNTKFKGITADMVVDEIDKRGLFHACMIGDAKLAEMYVLCRAGENINFVFINGYTALMIATEKGYMDLVRMLLHHKANVNHISDEGYSALMLAAQEGYLAIAEMLLEHNADVSFKNTKSQDNALMLATKERHIEIVKLLLTTSIDLQAVNVYGFNVLMLAAYYGYCEIIELLLKTDIDVHTVDTLGNSAICIASGNGHLDAVKQLLCTSIDINVIGKGGDTAFTSAIKNGLYHIVDILLQNNVDAEYVNPDGDNGLMISCGLGHVKIVELLLQNNVNLNKRNREGLNALILAVAIGHFEIVEMLLNAGADLTAIMKPVGNWNSATNINIEIPHFEVTFDVLSLAVKLGFFKIAETLLKHDVDKVLVKRKGNFLIGFAMHQDISLLKLLLEHSADCNQEFAGLKPLHIASILGLKEVVAVLLEFNADVYSCLENENNSLMMACDNKHYDVAKLLIRAKTNLNHKNKLGFTALHIAVVKGLTEVVEELVQNKCDLEAEISPGCNALCLANLHGHERIAEILINNNANCNKVTADGLSPLMLATFKESSRIVKLLLENDADINVIEHHHRCTALMYAAIVGSTEILEMICKSVKCCLETIKAKDLYGFTALMLASSYGHTNCVKILLNYSADCNLFNKHDTNALFLAVKIGQHDIVHLLLENGCNVNASDSRGYNALMLATMVNQLNIVTELLKHDVEINNVNKDDATALMLAVLSGSLEIVKLLVQHGADVNFTNKQCQNALIVAITQRNTAIAVFLLQKQAKSHLALNMAILYGQTEVVKRLLQKERNSITGYSHNQALLIAARDNNIEIIELIMNFCIETHDGKTINKIEAVVLKVENNRLSRSIGVKITKCNLHSCYNDLSIAFYLAENMHFIVKEPILYANKFEAMSFVLWMYLYSALESEEQFEMEIRYQMQYLKLAKLSYNSMSSIDPRRLRFKSMERSIFCLRFLQLSTMQKRQKANFSEELIRHARNVMEEYSKMRDFETVQYYIHHKCFSMIATCLTEHSTSQIVEHIILNKYAELTIRHLKKENLLGILTDHYLPPVVYNTLKTMDLFSSHSTSFAMSLVENGVIDLLTNIYMEYTTCARITNNKIKVPQTFILKILELFLTLANIQDTKQYFKASKTVKALRDTFHNSIFKQNIIILIAKIDGEATQLPSLTEKEIQDYIQFSNEKFLNNISANWVSGLKLIAENYKSSRTQISEYFATFEKMLNQNLPEFQEPVMDCLKVLSTSKESSSLIVGNHSLLKTLDDYRKSDLKVASDAEAVVWNSCRESGMWPQLPTELLSVELPKKFEIQQQISKGSFGAVFLLQDVKNPEQKQFVAKQISHDRKIHTVETILSEAQILLKAKHARIVQFHGYQIKNNDVYLFMEYLPKGTLARYIKDKNGLDEEKSRLFTTQILEGLDYLHQNSILHLDIKGNNILMESENSVKIADFGLSKIVTNEYDIVGIDEGTVRYIAPEVFKHDLMPEYCSRADIWSVGCTVVEMITQKPPDASIESQCVVFRIATDIKPTYTLPANSSEKLKAFLDKTFIVDPKQRPSAEELLKTDSFLLDASQTDV